MIAPSGSTNDYRPYLLPEEVNAQDMADLIRQATSSSSERKKLRKRFNGDGSLTYSALDRPSKPTSPSDNLVILSRQVWDSFEELCTVAQSSEDETANFERPFVVAMQEQQGEAPPRAIQAFVFPMGDENQSSHKPGDLLSARQQLSTAVANKMAYGHTHPCFPPPDEPLTTANSGMISNRKRRILNAGVTYGAMPSKIRVGWDKWIEMMRAIQQDCSGGECGTGQSEYVSSAAHEVIYEVIMRPKRYKRHGADYCMSLLHKPQACNPPGFGPVSPYEFILSPRLRQLGIFRNFEDGRCVYSPWVLER